MARKGGQKITSKQLTVLNIIHSNPSISRNELANKLDINVSAVRKHIDALRKKKLLKRVGPDKGGHWEVIK